MRYKLMLTVMERKSKTVIFRESRINMSNFA
jgi:hypothetical protein